jgi:SAM-dependent methyltransferase
LAHLPAGGCKIGATGDCAAARGVAGCPGHVEEGTVPERDWNSNYASGDLPWDTGQPDEHLVELVRTKVIAPGRALEIGCGTGTNVVWLAEHGFDVLGIDLAPLAIEKARAKAAGVAGCRFEVLDFLEREPPGSPYGFVFDRGCFHLFDDAEARARFAARVAGLLGPGGVWLSLIGSTEGGPRDAGPPRRSARDVMAAIEPALEVVNLHAVHFSAQLETPPPAWLCLARRRDTPAQPSTRHAPAAG